MVEEEIMNAYTARIESEKGRIEMIHKEYRSIIEQIKTATKNGEFEIKRYSIFPDNRNKLIDEGYYLLIKEVVPNLTMYTIKW